VRFFRAVPARKKGGKAIAAVKMGTFHRKIRVHHPKPLLPAKSAIRRAFDNGIISDIIRIIKGNQRRAAPESRYEF
jgi:hypothetical protein